MVPLFISGHFLLLFTVSHTHTHAQAHTHTDALLSCHRDSSGSCQISHSGVTHQQGFTSHHIPHIYVYTHTQTHTASYFEPLLMARHDFFSLLCGDARDSEILNPPNWSILSTDHLADFFLFINLPAEPLQQCCKSNAMAAIKHLYECLHGLQSISSLLSGHRLLLICRALLKNILFSQSPISIFYKW